MKIETLNEAIAEARRFIKAAETYKKVEAEEHKRQYPGTNPRESGAARRASLDLTRKLADLRLGR